MNTFLAILLALFVIVVGVVILHSSTSQLNFLKNLLPLQNGTSTSVLPYNYNYNGPGGGSATNTGASSPPNSGGGSGSVNGAPIPFGFTAKQLSPYFREVTITQVSSQLNDTNQYQSLVLQAQFNGAGSIDVSGWVLKANRGGEELPQAANILRTNVANQPSDILLKNNDSVEIVSSASPVQLSFRLNECTGYLAANPLLVPSPPQDCPTPPKTDIDTFTGACQDYLLSLSPCQLPSLSDPGAVSIPANDYGCRQYIGTLNYDGCVMRYQGATDFLSPQWWVYTGHQFLDTDHDRILLYDRKGLLVDEYDY